MHTPAPALLSLNQICIALNMHRGTALPLCVFITPCIHWKQIYACAPFALTAPPSSASSKFALGVICHWDCCCRSAVAGTDDMQEDEEMPAIRLGEGATEPSGDSAGLAPSHSGQYDSTGTGNEGTPAVSMLACCVAKLVLPCLIGCCACQKCLAQCG